jgi:hypothetical protein
MSTAFRSCKHRRRKSWLFICFETASAINQTGEVAQESRRLPGRLSLGIEDPDDIIEDIDQALKAANTLTFMERSKKVNNC